MRAFRARSPRLVLRLMTAAGDTVFRGGPVSVVPSTGSTATLLVAGDFTQSAGSTASFAATGLHGVVLNGTGIQRVSFSNPGTAAGTSGFSRLRQTNTAGVVSLLTLSIAITSTNVVNGPAFTDARGSTVTWP